MDDVNIFFSFQKFVDNAKQCFTCTPQAHFAAPNLNFHWRWMWWDRIQATILKSFLLYMLNLLRNRIPIDLKFWWILFSPKAQHKNDHHCHQCLSLFHIFFFHQDSEKFGLCVYWTLTATRSLYHHRSYSKGFFSGLFFPFLYCGLKNHNRNNLHNYQ